MDTGSREENAAKKNQELRSDSIGAELECRRMEAVLKRSWTIALRGMVLVLCVGGFAARSAAQSTDPHHPTVLGLGVNRADITNDVPGQYYTFMAGPGHVDVELAFKEMGLFGNPMRQHINFDFWNTDGVHLSHIEVVSEGDFGRRHTDADLPTRQRINLAVTTQWGAIKVGGYYEVELKGAVEPGAPVGADVKPEQSQPLTRP